MKLYALGEPAELQNPLQLILLGSHTKDWIQHGFKLYQSPVKTRLDEGDSLKEENSSSLLIGREDEKSLLNTVPSKVLSKTDSTNSISAA